MSVYRQVDPTPDHLARSEGGLLSPDTLVCEIKGNARIAHCITHRLNFLQTLSAVATMTRAYVDAVAGTRANIVVHPQDPARLKARAKIRRALVRWHQSPTWTL